jgi:hypothetical protein
MDPTKTRDEAEWGRKLKASELEVRTVVILSRDGLFGVTAWVKAVNHDGVLFLANAIRTHLLLQRLADETLVDDTGKQVRVFEYKGEV